MDWAAKIAEAKKLAMADAENVHTGVTIQLLSEKWMEVVFSSGLLRSQICGRPGYLICNFLSASDKEIEVALSSETPDNNIPFLYLREMRDSYKQHGLFEFFRAKSMFNEYFDICFSNGIAITVDSFSDFAVMYELSVPEFRFVPAFTEQEQMDMKGSKSKEAKDKFIASYMKAHKNYKYNDKAYYCKCGRYERSIIEQVCCALIYQILDSGHTFNKCELCGRLFVPNKADEKYCLRPGMVLSDKNCKQAAKYLKQIEREHSSDASRIYKSINTIKARRVKAATSPAQKQRLQEELFSFRNQADKWKEMVRSGEKKDTEYIEWLNSFKKRKNSTTTD